MKIFNDPPLEIRANPDVTVADVKKKIKVTNGRTAYQAEEFMLTHHGIYLQDDTTLADNKDPDNAVLFVILTRALLSGNSTATVMPKTQVDTSKCELMQTSTSSSTQKPATTKAAIEISSVATTGEPATTAVITTTASGATAGTKANVFALDYAVGNDFRQAMQRIIDMGGGTWDRDEVICALRNAHYNHRRAIEYLVSVQTSQPEAIEASTAFSTQKPSTIRTAIATTDSVATTVEPATTPTIVIATTASVATTDPSHHSKGNRQEVIRALRAAHNNPKMAFEKLCFSKFTERGTSTSTITPKAQVQTLMPASTTTSSQLRKSPSRRQASRTFSSLCRSGRTGALKSHQISTAVLTEERTTTPTAIATEASVATKEKTATTTSTIATTASAAPIWDCATTPTAIVTTASAATTQEPATTPTAMAITAAVAATEEPTTSPSTTTTTSSVAITNKKVDVFASHYVAGDDFHKAIQGIIAMGGGTWDRKEVVYALQAAHNNPWRAIEYLFSGSSRAGSTSSGAGLNGQQVRDLRSMVQVNPQLVEPMLQELKKQNPEIFSIIQEEQTDLIRVLHEPLE